MFRLIVIVLMAVIIADKTRTIFATGRTLGDPGYVRTNDPLGYWVVATAYACASAAALSGAVWLTYCAIAGAGPYIGIPFFSMQEQAYSIFLSCVLALVTYVTFSKRLRRLVSTPPRMHRKTYRQKGRRK